MNLVTTAKNVTILYAIFARSLAYVYRWSRPYCTLRTITWGKCCHCVVPFSSAEHERILPIKQGRLLFSGHRSIFRLCRDGVEELMNRVTLLKAVNSAETQNYVRCSPETLGLVGI